MLNKFARNALAFSVGAALFGSANAFVVNQSFSGNWSEEAPAGVNIARGVIIDIIPTPLGQPANDFSNNALIQWFTYRDGEPIWLFGDAGAAAIDKNTNTAEFDVFEFSGGAFGPPDLAGATDTLWGSATLNFTSCNSATLEYDGVDGTGTLELRNNTPKADCVVDEPFDGCPDFATEVAQPGSCAVGGPVNSDITLTNETLWFVQGQLTVEAGATLTIEPGTEIVGGTAGDTDTLIVRQGGTLISEGTPENPIVMRGPQAEDRAEWGGVVINGFAPINGCAEGVDPCTAQGEGDSGTYGGNDPHDNSGVLKYTIVSNAGRQFSEENELNGIAFQGVGDGTTVEFVQVHLNQDDGVEFFGGTVNAKNLVLTGIGDDSLDWTQGWQGNVQYVVAKQYSDGEGDQGIEADNNGDANDSTPRAKPTLANMTYVGQSTTDIGWLLREGTGATIANSVVTGFGEYCVDIDNQSTFDNEENLTVANSIAGGCALGTFDDADGDSFLVSAWFLDQGNLDADPMLDNIVPMSGSPAFGIGAVPFTDAFFDNVDYAGAIRDEKSDWTKGWTVGLDRDAP